jgi:hypothetical protein
MLELVDVLIIVFFGKIHKQSQTKTPQLNGASPLPFHQHPNAS